MKRPGTSKRVVPWALTPEESEQLLFQEARKLYAWLQKRIRVSDWRTKNSDTQRDLIREERERIVGTRLGRVARIRRKAEPVASSE